jgi:formylglycine-generating enzyme required for sulfatase activity
VSDRELRRLEQALAVQPDAAELHRQKSEQLWRMGRSDAALAALDLAWRLGAPVWEQLQARLQERRVVLDGITLCYVPAGPFVMGRDDFDDDAPPHLVELSAFYVAQAPLGWRALWGWEHFPSWVQEDNAWFMDRVFYGTFERVGQAMAHLQAELAPADLPGRYRLPSEAQWERVVRSRYLRPDGRCPYGPSAGDAGPEWTRDHYHADSYTHSPRQDPQGPKAGELRVVRGIAVLGAPQFASFREAAREDGSFPVPRRLVGTRWLPTYPDQGLAVSPVFEPA